MDTYNWWSKMDHNNCIIIPSVKYVDAWLAENNHICTRDWTKEEGGYPACDCTLPSDKELKMDRMKEENEVVDKVVKFLKSRSFQTYKLRCYRVRILHSEMEYDWEPVEAIASTFAEACQRAKDLFDKQAARLKRRKKDTRITKVQILGVVDAFDREKKHAKIRRSFVIDTHFGNSDYLACGECYHVACGMAWDDFLHRLERTQAFHIRDQLHRVFIWRRMRAMRKNKQQPL